MKKWQPIMMTSLLLLALPIASAANKPIFIVAANVVNKTVLPGGAGVVSFTVTNATSTNFTSHLGYIANSTANSLFQTTLNPSTTCTTSLLSGQSCSLVVNVTAGPVTGTGSLTPKVCYYQSNCSTGSAVAVTVGAVNERFAYVGNYSGTTVSLCTINSSAGTLSGCVDSGGTGFSNPAFIAINAAGTRAYVTNNNAGNPAGSVSLCSVNSSTGALSGCVDSGGSGFAGPAGIVLK